MKYNHEIQIKLQDRLNRCIEYFAFLICHCKSTTFAYNKYCMPNSHSLLEQKDGYTDQWFHHYGHIYDLIKSHKQISIDAYVNDLDHGVFHGFCTAFLATFDVLIDDIFSLEYNKELNSTNQLFISCLLHDILKCDNVENHDKNLQEYFPLLSRITYEHTIADNYPLIYADREELRRFHDYPKWLDYNKLKIYKALKEEIDHFYYYIRPALQRIYQYKDDIWLKHGTENGYSDYYYEPGWFYPKLHWQTHSEIDGYYAVDNGRFFDGCLRHYEGIHPWGFIPFGIIKKYKGHFIHADGGTNLKVDHLGMNHNIPINEWIFDVDNIKLIEQRKPSYIYELCNMYSLSHGVIGIQLARKFVRTINKFIDVMRLLNESCN